MESGERLTFPPIGHVTGRILFIRVYPRVSAVESVFSFFY